MAAPMSSKACRWALVGSVSIGTATSVPVNRTWLRVKVARCSSRARKLRISDGRVVLARGLGLGAGGTAGGGDRAGRGGRVLVGEGERRPCLARVPGEVAGEHADQHVGPGAFFEPVEDGPQVQVVSLDVAEVPLHVLEVLAGGHHGGRVQLAGGALYVYFVSTASGDSSSPNLGRPKPHDEIEATLGWRTLYRSTCKSGHGALRAATRVSRACCDVGRTIALTF